MSDVRHQKTQLRQQVRAQARAVSVRGDEFEHSPLNDFLSLQQGVWGAFYPFQSEPPILGVLARASHLTWVFPRLFDQGMSFHRCPIDRLAVGTMGFREPPADAPRVEPGEMQGALIPGLAFDRRGARLGRGRGHYDRFLGGLRGTKTGVVWSYGLVNEVPLEEHDLKVDAVATENEIIFAAPESLNAKV